MYLAPKFELRCVWPWSSLPLITYIQHILLRIVVVSNALSILPSSLIKKYSILIGLSVHSQKHLLSQTPLQLEMQGWDARVEVTQIQTIRSKQKLPGEASWKTLKRSDGKNASLAFVSFFVTPLHVPGPGSATASHIVTHWGWIWGWRHMKADGAEYKTVQTPGSITILWSRAELHEISESLPAKPPLGWFPTIFRWTYSWPCIRHFTIRIP